jgi:purine-nucleoside/S-methyl-5'-thioadenosine phosphorylase / adenosine deaminase
MITPTLFPLFEKLPLLHANSTRFGGVSTGNYSSLNLGIKTNDSPENIQQNRALFFDHFKISQENLVFPRQVHADYVEAVDKPGIIKDCDALITSTPGLAITIQTADCFPLFIYDQRNHTCAIVHSGWRGTAKNIAQKTLAKMYTFYKTKPGDVLVAIGAGIQQKNYQVDGETAKYFDPAFLLADGKNHFKLSVQDAIISQLREYGVPSQNIEVDRTCTFEAKEKYFSYRRDGVESGRMMGFICLDK